MRAQGGVLKGFTSAWHPSVWMLLIASLAPSVAQAFATNSFRFESMPVRWWYNPANEPPLPSGVTWESVIEAAAATWSAVGCADVSFVYEGIVETGWADDGKNVIYWPDEWLFQAGAAGATLHDPQDEGETREVDLALNGLNFQWVLGGGDALQTDVLDPQSVITHELGHWLGLSHSSDQFATMYAAKLIGAMQASLNSDDKFGLCTIYPNGDNECQVHADCPPGYGCHDQPGGDLRACGELRTPIGGACSKDNLDCVDMCFISFWDCSAICAFTSEDLNAGYCARLCLNANGEALACDEGHSCKGVPGYDIKACYRDPESQPEAAEPSPETAGRADLATDSAEVRHGDDDPRTAEGSDTSSSVALTGGCSNSPGPPWLGAGLLVLAITIRRRRTPQRR